MIFDSLIGYFFHARGVWYVKCATHWVRLSQCLSDSAHWLWAHCAAPFVLMNPPPTRASITHYDQNPHSTCNFLYRYDIRRLEGPEFISRSAFRLVGVLSEADCPRTLLPRATTCRRLARLLAPVKLKMGMILLVNFRKYSENTIDTCMTSINFNQRLQLELS